MARPFEQWIVDVMSGRSRGVGASLTRVALGAVEPVYAGVAAARNRRFDRRQAGGERLAQPVVSIGNLTTGGTGKTPAVQWLVRVMLDRGERPGVLLRGYRKESSANGASDEEQLLRESLGVPVVADADRVRGAATMLAAHAFVSLIVLDDGFQHRRVHRDCDIVLIDATNPFGFGHVLPRGLLREPIAGLARAHLVILTRTDQADIATIAEIESQVRKHNASVPIAHASHRLTRGISADGEQPIEAFRGTRAFAVSGIGNPAAFERSLPDAGIVVTAARRFEDHHAYKAAEIEAIIAAARGAKAERIVTTEKDWVKLATLEAVRRSPIPFVRAALQFEFCVGDEAIALATIDQRIKRPND